MGQKAYFRLLTHTHIQLQQPTKTTLKKAHLNLIVYIWTRVHSGVPDVPHAAKHSGTVRCAEGSGVGFNKEPPVFAEESSPKLIYNEVVLIGEAQLKFLFDISDDVTVSWDAVLYSGGRLLVKFPDLAFGCCSKESFVRLLEFAEESLDCREVYMEFARGRRDRTLIIRTFMYFGFSLLSPDETPLPISVDNLVMKYVIE
ncbi:unnamed protein product [Soboliphyme baturini]|uniref:Ornithine decarboxylase antizyme n=1 Tax=Soboliphyme baturini TaxID=241478 RepID=A0A183IQM0_9BILA|nr:unnamed protein product [Soboliphyme baturini]